MEILAKIDKWLQGYKTILAGIALILVAMACAFYGAMSASTAITVGLLGLSIAGFADKANRHQDELIATLQSLAVAGVDLRAGNKAGAIAEMKPVLVEAAQAAAVAAEAKVVEIPTTGAQTGK